MIGSCIQFDRTKGYGFLLPVEDPMLPDVFVHFSAVMPNEVWKRRFLLPGMRVQFDIEFDPADVEEERPRAKNVRAIGPVVIARQTGERGPRS